MLGDKCGGNFTYMANGVKNCTDCMVPHQRNAVQYVLKRWPEIAERAKKTEE
jgi:Zn-finger protein